MNKRLLHLLLALALILGAATSQASDLQLPATGQTLLQAVGDDGAVQAGKPWPVPRFTGNRNGTIMDNLTGLLWSGDANLLAASSVVAGSGGVVTWQSALDEIKRLNASAYLGFNDWRLSNLNELASLVHQGEPVQSRWLNRQGFSNTTASNYWSSSSVARETDRGWTVHLDSGSAGSLPKSSAALVWPVRGGSSLLPATGQIACYDTVGLKIECSGTGQDGDLRSGISWTALRFADNGNGTISDNLTGLIWPKNANPALDAGMVRAGDGATLWPDALDFVANLNSTTYLGYGDWRLPNRNELVSLVNYAETTPGIQLSMVGVEGVQERYWSSGTSAANPSAAWDVTMNGEVAERGKYDLRFGSYIWPVRGGIDTQTTSGTQSKILSKTVAAAAVTLSVTTTTLAAGTIGITYSQTLTAAGGTTPYTWSRKSGTLPAGLTLSTTGVISGKPTTTGSSSFTVQVKDGNNSTATALLTLTIGPAVSVTSSTLSSGTVGSAYSHMLTAGGGKMPYSWGIASGTLPPGLTLDTSTGAISGTPTAAGSSSFTAQVTDANNMTASGTMYVTINILVSITTPTLHDSFNGIAYSGVLAATGGVPPYAWLISEGSLPAGLSLDTSTGSISGTPTTTGTSNFTVQVRDAVNAVSSKAYSVNITGFGSINGLVTEQSTGAPIPGATVTLNLSGITTKNSSDFIFTCEDLPIAANVYSKIAENDDVKLGCSDRYGARAIVRNPYGVADPFTIRWNGLSAYSGGEYLAQSFKPTKSGILNRVSFYFSGFSMMYGTQGAVSVQLKPSLGGDRSAYLATSAVKTVTLGTPTGWLDFDFTAPVTVTAGQEYFIELQGDFATWPFMSGTTYYDAALWGNGVQYPDGRSYQRTGGIWGPIDNSLAFRTYVDATPDITTALPTQGIDMHGAASYEPKIELSNYSTGVPEKCYMDFSGKAESYGNSSDYNCAKTVAGGNSYYDQNGWITVTLYSQSSYSSYSEMDTTLIVTDKFSLTFNRTLTTVTDVNGVYSFGDLPDGAYTISINKPSYSSATSTGTLTPGQTLNLPTTIANALPATILGNIQLIIGTASGITVSLTDQLGTHNTVTDAGGNYRIDGITSGPYSITFSGDYLETTTQTGTLASGQTAILNVTLTISYLKATITYPLNSATVVMTPLVVSGTAINAETVVISAYNAAGNAVEYQGIVTNGTFSIPIEIKVGRNDISRVSAVNPRMTANYKGITFNAPFLIRNLGDSGNVAMMETTANFDVKNADGSSNSLPRQEIAREYIRSHGDATDFLVFLSTFDYAIPGGAKGFYSGIKNDVSGINQPIMDNTALFGSNGKLQGMIDLGNAAPLIANPYEAKLTVLNHEIMHRFGAFVGSGYPEGSSLLGKDGSHWSYLLDTKGSLMYGNGWQDNGDGTFTSTAAMNSYSQLDLYLMGMIDKSQVPPMLLIDNPAIDKTLPPLVGSTITGASTTVTIDDIITAEGERVPAAATAQKQFKVGFVLLKRAGDDVTALVKAIEIQRKTWAAKFNELTQGKGSFTNIPASIELAIDSPADGATITGPDVTVQGSVINFSNAETGVTVNGVPVTVSGYTFTANHVPLQLGSNSIEIKATDVNGLTTTTTKTVTAQEGHYIRIRSNIESGTAPLEASLKIEGSFEIINPQISASGATIEWLPWTSLTELGVKVTSEGTATITVSAVGPDGQTYSDSVTVTAISRSRLESLLKAKWEGMRTALESGDVTGAVANFCEYSKNIYQQQLTDLVDVLPQIASGMGNISLVKVNDTIAEFDMRDVIDGVTHSFYLLFVKERDGIWRIRNF